MNVKKLNQMLINEGRDLRYITGFWHGYRLGMEDIENELSDNLMSQSLDCAEVDAEYLLKEKQRQAQK